MKKYQNNYFNSLILLFFLLFASSSNGQTQFYSAQQLTELTEQWLAAEAIADASERQFQVTALDNRISARPCDSSPQFSLPQRSNQRQTTVQISCTSPAPWQLFIPVRMTELVEVLVMRQNIATGTPLTADMLQSEQRDRHLIRGNLEADTQRLIGARSRRALNMGQIVSLQDLCLVCRGDVVTIQIDNKGLMVSATGIAQTDGTLGDTVPVRNQQSGRTIQTEVVAVNQVRVKF